MSALSLGRGLAALVLLLAATPITAATGPWEQIYLDGPIQTILPDGSARTLHPSCSGGPQSSPTGPAADTRYSFFIRKGNPNKVLFALDGGGACWNALTCVTLRTYVRHVTETPEELAAMGGLFDAGNPENPYHEYTHVFVPYCTGDVHWGSIDRSYTAGGVSWNIRHRGADNFLAVIDWLRRHGSRYQVDLRRVQELTVGGPSAGGYGALLAFPYLAQLTPRARHSLLVDGAAGVLTPAGYAATIYNAAAPGSEAWQVSSNLPPWVPGLGAALVAGGASPNSFAPMYFAALADKWPAAHLSSLTHDFDHTQIQFYALMGGGSGAAAACGWNAHMRAIMAATASTATWRHFIDAGPFHTFVRSNPLTYDVGPNGVSLADWIRNMIKPGSRTWNNLNAGASCP